MSLKFWSLLLQDILAWVSRLLTMERDWLNEHLFSKPEAEKDIIPIPTKEYFMLTPSQKSSITQQDVNVTSYRLAFIKASVNTLGAEKLIEAPTEASIIRNVEEIEKFLSKLCIMPTNDITPYSVVENSVEEKQD